MPLPPSSSWSHGWYCTTQLIILYPQTWNGEKAFFFFFFRLTVLDNESIYEDVLKMVNHEQGKKQYRTSLASKHWAAVMFARGCKVEGNQTAWAIVHSSAKLMWLVLLTLCMSRFLKAFKRFLGKFLYIFLKIRR